MLGYKIDTLNSYLMLHLFHSSAVSVKKFSLSCDKMQCGEKYMQQFSHALLQAN